MKWITESSGAVVLPVAGRTDRHPADTCRSSTSHMSSRVYLKHLMRKVSEQCKQLRMLPLFVSQARTVPGMTYGSFAFHELWEYGAFSGSRSGG